MTVEHNLPVPTFCFAFTPNPSPKKSKNLKPDTLFFFFSKTSCINLGQPVGKGRKLGKKKNPGSNPGQPAGKRRKEKTKKKLGTVELV